MSNFQKNLVLVLVFGLTLPLAVVLSTRLATRSFERVKMQQQTLSVKGSAEQLIQSDFATWSFTIQAHDEKDLKAAFARLEEGKAKLFIKLKAAGVPDGQLAADPVQFSLLHPRDEHGNEIPHLVSSYIAHQRFTLSSDKVPIVTRAALDASSLLNEGVEIKAGQPQYLCNNLSSLKVRMLADATANARERAKQLMGDSGVCLGSVRAASQGVFQITSPGSVEASSGGEYDTTTPAKVIRATVTLEYALLGS